MIKELIDQFYLESQQDRSQTKFYITDAGKCPRSVFFKLKSAPKEKLDPRILRIYERGEDLHRHIFNVLYRLKIGCVVEIPIPPQSIISGRADAILCLKGENHLLDIKSINSNQFKYMKAPKEENICQLQLYMHYFDVKKGILLYIDKDRQDLKEFLVDYDHSLAQNLINSFEELKEKIEKNIIPQALQGYPGNWQCSYCQYRSLCDMAGPVELNWLKLKDQLRKSEESTS